MPFNEIFVITYTLCHCLMLGMLGKNCSRQHFEIFFWCFPENRFWHSPRRQFACNVKAYFWWEYKKNNANLSSAEFAKSEEVKKALQLHSVLDYMSKFRSEPSPVFIVCVCEQWRLWWDCTKEALQLIEAVCTKISCTGSSNMGESSKFQKSWTLEIQIFKLAGCLQNK